VTRLPFAPDYSASPDGRIFSHKSGKTRELRPFRVNRRLFVNLCVEGDVERWTVRAIVDVMFGEKVAC
jgi:hypothetical protein